MQLKKFSVVELQMEDLDLKRAVAARAEAARVEAEKANTQGGASSQAGEAPTDGAGAGVKFSLTMFLFLCFIHYF